MRKVEIWQLTGKLHKDNLLPNRDAGSSLVTLNIHAGLGTLDDSRSHGDFYNIVVSPDKVPDPLLVLTTIKNFEDLDVFSNDGFGLIVGARFVAEFIKEIEEYCKVYGVKVAKMTPEAYMTSNREELLNSSLKGVNLDLIMPIYTIIDESPEFKERRVFVDYQEDLPPFFRVPWKFGSIFIRNDIKERIEKAGLKGAEFNFYPWE